MKIKKSQWGRIKMTLSTDFFSAKNANMHI